MTEVSFTPRMHRIVSRAETIAAEHELSVIGAEHIMIALLEDEDAVPTAVLRRSIEPEHVVQQLLDLMASDGYRNVPKSR